MEISKIWLKTEDENTIVVLVEIDGKWHKLIEEYRSADESSISHCVHVKNMLPLAEAEHVTTNQNHLA